VRVLLDLNLSHDLGEFLLNLEFALLGDGHLPAP
jgi:hypothetical protein